MKIAVLLGHRLNDDRSISSIMESRLELAWEAWSRFHPDRMILSGGIANKTAGVSEASAMYHHLREKGIPEEVLVLEEKSRSTRENARFSVQMANDFKADHIVLITSLEHLNRWYLNPIRLFKKEIGKTPILLSTYPSRTTK